jgi:hypothetical protein
MSSIIIPSYRRTATLAKFPYIENTKDVAEVCTACNLVLDEFPELVVALGDDVKDGLLRGNIRKRMWAFLEVRKAYKSEVRALEASADNEYIEVLQAAQAYALESPVSAFLHRSLQDSLAIAVSLDMSREAREELLAALADFRDLERMTEDTESVYPSAPQRRTKRSKSNHRKTVAKRQVA